MRIVQPGIFAWNVAIVSIVAVGVGMAVGSAAGIVTGALCFVIGAAVIARRPIGRWKAARRGLEPGVRAWFERNVPQYVWMDDEGRRRFERDAAFILDEWRFEAVGDVVLDDELRAMVAAAGALLVHGRPELELPSRHTALFYPDRFDDDYLSGARGSLDGMAHSQGPVILSVDALRADWADPTNGHNVALHELAHLLDFKGAFALEEPDLGDDGRLRGGEDLVAREMRRIRAGHSMLRRYGATNRAEFFAVAVENYFERPDAMSKRHPELFGALREYFGYVPMLEPITRPITEKGSSS